MSSTTLQFVVVGALIAAWAWMLGRPVLTSLLRRSRRDSVGHFRYQQAVLGQSLFDDATDEGSAAPLADVGGRPRPIAEWRSQPVERKRLQLMLSFAIATFVSLLMAIALRGAFIQLFVLMAVCFATYLGIAAIIGASQLRRQEREYAAQRQATAPEVEAEFWAEPEVGRVFGEPEDLATLAEPADEIDADPSAASILDGLATYDDLASFGQGIFDDEFFEPIPELASQFGESRSDYEPVELDHEEPDTGLDSFDYVSPFEYTPLSEPHSVLWADLDADEPEEVPAEDTPAEEVSAEEVIAESDIHFSDTDLSDIDLSDVDVEPVSAASSEEPTFKAAPEQRVRPPQRNKARPIYIESQLDEAEQQKAVND